MRYHVPDLYLAEELPVQSALQDKLGGLPWGFPARLWPVCKDCGTPLALLAQFVHEADRLDLGRAGRVLHVFQCNADPGACEVWDGASGANACLVLEPEDMAGGLCAAPAGLPTVEREARVQAWLPEDDGVSSDVAPSFFSKDAYMALPDELVSNIGMNTRLGGVPSWEQSPDEAPSADDGWRFVAQLNEAYFLRHVPATDGAAIRQFSKPFEGCSHYCEGFNLGGGIGYIFVRHDTPGTAPQGWFFWQCG